MSRRRALEVTLRVTIPRKARLSDAKAVVRNNLDLEPWLSIADEERLGGFLSNFRIVGFRELDEPAPEDSR